MAKNDAQDPDLISALFQGSSFVANRSGAAAWLMHTPFLWLRFFHTIYRIHLQLRTCLLESPATPLLLAYIKRTDFGIRGARSQPEATPSLLCSQSILSVCLEMLWLVSDGNTEYSSRIYRKWALTRYRSPNVRKSSQMSVNHALDFFFQKRNLLLGEGPCVVVVAFTCVRNYITGDHWCLFGLLTPSHRVVGYNFSATPVVVPCPPRLPGNAALLWRRMRRSRTVIEILFASTVLGMERLAAVQGTKEGVVCNTQCGEVGGCRSTASKHGSFRFCCGDRGRVCEGGKRADAAAIYEVLNI